MKKIILALLAVCSVATVDAQKGSWLLYGNVGFNSTTTDTAKTNYMSWNVNPGIGYQFNDNWTAGLNLGYSQQSQKDNVSGDRYTINNYNVGPFIRYAHAIGGIFSWYGQLNVGYMGGYSTLAGSPSFDKNTGFGANVVPTIAMSIGHGYALNASIGGLGYTSSKYSDPTFHNTDNNNTSFNFTFGQQLSVGLSKNFGCHKMHGHHEPGDDMHHIDASNDNDDDAPKAHHKHHHKEKKDKDNDD